jgi:hypothetical protein
LAFLISLIVGDLVSHAGWIRLVVFAAMLTAFALFLRFGVGWPWSRILRYRDPANADPSASERPLTDQTGSLSEAGLSGCGAVVR